MADAMTSAHPAAQWFRRDLDAVQSDLLDALQRHGSKGSQVLAHGVIEFTGSVLASICESEPAARADIDLKLSEMRLFVTTSGQQAQ